MKQYEKINGEYTQEEMLQIDKDKLSDAQLKLKRNLNPIAKELYEKEVIELKKSIKERTLLLTNNNGR